MYASALTKFLSRIVTPPFVGLPVVIWVYFVLAYIILPDNPIWRGTLPDPDDYTYLTQTLDWLQGQAWFDNVQHRMSPPDGVAIHYTRFVELPIAAIISLLRALHYSWRGAALLTSFLLPVVYLAFFFAALRWTASKIINHDWARLTSFIVLFAPILMFKFAPGQVDHHDVEAILIILSIGLTAQIFSLLDQLRWSIIAGFTLALATAIALEVLPWMVLISATVGLWATMMGAKAVRPAAVFGVSLFITSALLLLLDKPFTQICQPDILAYSIAYVALTGGIAMALLATALFACFNIKLRFVLCATVAVALGVIYLMYFPALLKGPYGAMDPRLAALFFANLEEAVPMVARYGFYQIILHIMPSLIGLCASTYFFRKSTHPNKLIWLLFILLLLSAITLALFYQIRVLIYASLFSVIPLAAFVEHGWRWIGKCYQDRQQFWAEVGLILLIGPLTAIFFPALQDARSLNVGVLLFPAQTVDDSCDMHGVEQVLNAPPYAGKTLRIANTIDEGPELLFRTSHSVMSAPYHTNVHGNLDALDLFSAADDVIAQKIVQRDGIDLIVLCRHIPDMYLQGAGPHYALFPNGDIKMLPNSALAGRLALHQNPMWLSEIPMSAPSNYVMFAVK